MTGSNQLLGQERCQNFFGGLDAEVRITPRAIWMLTIIHRRPPPIAPP